MNFGKISSLVIQYFLRFGKLFKKFRKGRVARVFPGIPEVEKW
jgi:hypothetical protein